MSFRKQYLLTLGWILFLMFLALITPNPANAQRLEFGIGKTNYSTQNDVWYNVWQGPYQIYDTPTSEVLSLTVPGWKASFVNLGHGKIIAKWDHTSALGQGDVTGLTLGKTYEHNLGQFVLGAEGGLFLYRYYWREQFIYAGNTGIDYSSHTNLTGYVGINGRYKILFGQIRWYPALKAGGINHDATQVLFGVSVPFGGEK